MPTSPSAYALLLVLLATIGAKTYSASSLAQGDGFALEAFGACAADLLVYAALALLVAAGERMRPWVAYLTYTLSTVAVVVALINAAYLVIANDQIDARAIDVGINRIDEVADIALMEALARAGRFGAYVLFALPLGYVVIRAIWKRQKCSKDELASLRIRGLTWLMVFGAIASIVARTADLPRTLAVDLISDNALVHTYTTWVANMMAPIAKYQGSLEKHFALPMVAPDAMKRIAEMPNAPNVVILILESTRFDYVDLPISGHRSAARTPNLRKLAERGTIFTDAHATMPHTSKSMVSFLCGRVPAMENAVLEPADGVLQQCLPELFRSAGYATAFMQTALGSFEYRPRTTVRLGYDTFFAFENIGTTQLGYLAGDDRALPRALTYWLGNLPPEQRFFATLLTSGTHHPYDVPPDIQGVDRTDGNARYTALVEMEDKVLGSIVELLRRTGRLDNTLIVALADHGEGLAGNAVHQHDNNFFNESLHVPLIIAGPGVPAGRYDGLTSLLDVAPTLLGILGVETILPDNELRFGSKRLGNPKGRKQAPFACWNNQVCEGYISRNTKVVRLEADSRELAFDRKTDPTEMNFREPTEAEHRELERLRNELAITHLTLAPIQAEAIRLPSGFACGPGGSQCAHPSRPHGGFHEPIHRGQARPH